MVSNKTSKKTKKPIETTLGKCAKEKDNDVSHLRRPIETSIYGIKQLIAVWESATTEVKDLLALECDIMYECRACRSIFRSLANFLLHKREFCTNKFLSTHHQLNNNNIFELNINTGAESKAGTKPSLEKVVQKLQEIDQVCESAKKSLTEDLIQEEPVRNMEDFEVQTSCINTTVLEKIDSSSAGVFQTLVNDPPESDIQVQRREFMKSEVMEIHKKLENDVPVLDPEGKISSVTSSKYHKPSIFPKSDLKCMECNNQFATKKSLTTHLKLVHNPSRILYVCPTCKETFANPWCVYRHLLKVHRVTNKQVRRMREQVHNSFVRRDEIATVQKKKAEANQNLEDRDNQWINDIEGDKDFQMCAGCGKHFERKAALHSHSQMCAKRLEVCNNIKENARKKEEALEKAKLGKPTAEKLLKGASKRKGRVVHSYRRPSVRDELESNKLAGNITTVNPSSASPILSPSNSVDEAICLSSSDESGTPIKERPAVFGSPQSSKSSGVMENFSQIDAECLLSNDVSFETFCKRVESKSDSDLSTKIHALDTEEDVVFVGQTSPRSLINLSCNNPLKSKLKESIPKKKKLNSSVSKKPLKGERNLVTRARDYMDRFTLRCIPCGITFKSFNFLLYHMAAHFSWFRFQCSKCSFFTYSKFDCVAHSRKQHKSAENLALPLPSWKTVLMSHDFILLKDLKKLRGRHADEDIKIEEDIPSLPENTVQDLCIDQHSILFEECPVQTKLMETTDTMNDDSSIIDMQEINEDCEKLPEPVELAMPAHVHVSEMCNFNDDLSLEAQDANDLIQAIEECNDDWGLSRVCTGKDELLDAPMKDVQKEMEPLRNEKLPVNMRPARIRTKAKKDDNFLYYDNSSRNRANF